MAEVKKIINIENTLLCYTLQAVYYLCRIVTLPLAASKSLE